MAKPKKRGKRGDTVTFHGAYKKKSDAKRKESARKGSWIKGVWINGRDHRFLVLTQNGKRK